MVCTLILLGSCVSFGTQLRHMSDVYLLGQLVALILPYLCILLAWLVSSTPRSMIETVKVNSHVCVHVVMSVKQTSGGKGRVCVCTCVVEVISY